MIQVADQHLQLNYKWKTIQFVKSEYNKLFPEDKQVELDEENALTLELRIFALIRLGITNSEKVSQFLNLSVNTIYAYKTRIKAKSLVPKEEFEYYIMRIKRVYN